MRHPLLVSTLAFAPMLALASGCQGPTGGAASDDAPLVAAAPEPEAPTPAAAPAAEPDANEATPAAALHAWAESLRSGDLERVLACYETSPQVVVIHSYGKVDRGGVQVREEYRAAFDEVVFEDVKVLPDDVRQAGDVAWVTGRLLAGTRRRADDTRWTLEAYTTFVLRRENGRWRIVLEQSTPLAGTPRLRPRDG